MSASQKIFKVRRHYNKWVADQTLEDYALRYTAKQGHSMSIERVANTAFGATAFLALEGIAAAITLNYGFTNAISAIFVVLLVFFITGFPIAYYCAKHGLDIDLLTRGAGFGYLGSTVTSLIYATFTFIFFAIEAAILASALQVLFGIPIFIGYALSAVFVIPIVTHGIRAISRFQGATQWVWLILQFTALFVVIANEYDRFSDWTHYQVPELPESGHFNIVLFGAAASVIFALMGQIGEQVDYLRFMPEKTQANKKRWWFWLIMAGPGWVFMGGLKMLLGSFLAYLAFSNGVPFIEAADPTHMYQRIFQFLTNSPALALILAAVMVFICQMKINLTNAYAGSIAWSNFFSRLTHSHPGRVVWLVFNVTIALLLMELGIYQALAAVLGVFAITAISWIGSLAADLLINKPLGLSPNYVEFKRAHLYDINPVGTGSMLIATTLGFASYLGVFGDTAKALCQFVSLASCFVFVPLIAWLTKGKYYIARQSPELVPLINLENANRENASPETPKAHTLTCGICENPFEVADMSFCSAYMQPICSLCCSLDVRCLDSCKPRARIAEQSIYFLRLFLPKKIVRLINSRLGRFVTLLVVINILNGVLMALVYRQMAPQTVSEAALLQQTMWMIFFTLLIVSGVLSWLFLLAHESRVVAQKESNRQTRKLTKEIEAHKITDQALQSAKELAERSNAAKSRYLTGISHELRTPLQSIIGYAQLLSDQSASLPQHQHGLGIIQRSGEYLADLIEGLLDISKIEAGRLDLYRNVVDLPALIDQLDNMFSMQATSKGVLFQTDIRDPLPPTVMVDEKRLRQILINLLSNAVKYTKQGQVDFAIRYRNQVAEFIIKDTGAGIPADQLDRIFDPFERVRNADTANLPGTGLGLTIVKLLTDIMGGDLQATSLVGSGSQFKVSLMLPWINKEQAHSEKRQHIIGYQGFQKKIFVVDDDPVVRGLLSDILVPLDFIAYEAHDAKHCLSQLESITPDLFLLDVSMPGMNGLELAKALRQRGIKNPIVMLSADAQEQHRQADEKAAFDDYLIKPVNNHTLLKKLGQHLHLTWLYQTATTEALKSSTFKTNDLKNNASPSTIEQSVEKQLKKHTTPVSTLPDHDLIRELIAFAEMGYRKGVKQTLKQIEDGQLVPAEMFQRLENFSNAFQFDLLVNDLKAHATGTVSGKQDLDDDANNSDSVTSNEQTLEIKPHDAN
ncbi:Aerobic respiration control sensor protein ArcB [Marinomonas spartinae]|uniref:hybrid sensor histidine kinase/response regulator n=1 Tax=Marinomonas spartinae TaxID=1792290 RepID=UPI000808C629|nr:ATP-binding protein [Marinomonas spartinae]SBS28925.1 Aerobic respiration control sensor protein ArcB [Marinomonas spartinae]